MHHLVLFVFLLSAAYSEIIEPKPQPSGVTLSPSYAQPGMNPSYTGPSQPSEVTSGSPGTVYGQTNPVQPTYNQESPAVYPAYGYPEYGYGYQPYPVKKNEESGMIKTLGAILPVIRFFLEEYTKYEDIKLISQAFHLILRIAGKVGLFLLGGAALLLVGGAFTAAVCTVTPICTFTFMGYGLSNEQVRSLMSPDRISIATNLVNEAIDKYAKLQGVMDGKNL